MTTLSPYLPRRGCARVGSRNMPLGRESAQKRHGYCAAGGTLAGEAGATPARSIKPTEGRGGIRVKTWLGRWWLENTPANFCDVSPTIRGAILGEWRNVKTRAWTSKIGNDAAMRERSKPWSFHVSTFANNPPPNLASVKSESRSYSGLRFPVAGSNPASPTTLSAWRNVKTHREIASSDALAEMKRVIPDVIAASEQTARSLAGSNPAALANLL